MNKNTEENKAARRSLMTAAGLAFLGGAVFTSRKAKAVIGEENAALLAIKAHVAQIYGALKEAADFYNSIATTINSLLDKAKRIHKLIEDVREYDKAVQRQIAAVRRGMNQIYRVGKDPLNNRMPKINLRTQAVVRETNRIIKEAADIIQQSSTSEQKNRLALSSRVRAGNVLGRLASEHLREKTRVVKEEAVKHEGSEKSAAQVFGENSGALAVDQAQLQIETLLRLEGVMIELLETLKGQKQAREQSFGPKDLSSAIERYQSGEGTLL